ncbi:MAG: hypothetical protein LUG83_04670, partial [Lachnospiraceae bacterium]|nr:hypothetical protein [Lachnospiraceae bacterium]
MKFVRGISLFVIYPLIMLGLGFFSGIWTYRFFYPGYGNNLTEAGNAEQQDYVLWSDMTQEGADSYIEKADSETVSEPENNYLEDMPYVLEEESISAASVSELLTADTEYVLEETDVLKNIVVETVLSLPHKYIGMNREQFLEAIGDYGENPPLSELERGFIGLEVLSFSKDRVVVQMNYKY